MNIINNKTVSVATSSELKEALENNNGYKYIYLESDITLKSGITINSKKSKVIINGAYQNITGHYCCDCSYKRDSSKKYKDYKS